MHEGYPYVNVDMPPVTGISLKIDEAMIVHADDALAASPLKEPTVAKLTVLVQFADGQEIDFTTDSRTVYAVGPDDTSNIEVRRRAVCRSAETHNIVLQNSMFAPRAHCRRYAFRWV